MLSRKFFAENLSICQGREAIASNHSTIDQDKMEGKESTSTAVSYLSSDELSPPPRDFSADSSQMLRRRLNVEQDLDFGIPGAYR